MSVARADGREVRGRFVATAATPYAAHTAGGVLASGGTAFDAAIAAALVEGVELPMKCGLAGDVVALHQRH
ncbi:MAG: gamma-glutamyltransferase, partial [Rhodospirillaceae bacterium]|nr:gamma-glutamyltransferase [Rhodospirillaceae bacterium]